MNVTPLISIITPVYNAEQYLPETIDSVISQTYNHWEWILVDDCSADNSYAILKEMERKDVRIKVYRNKLNSGAYFARNRALDIAKGEFIAFIDADDLWTPKKLKMQVEFMLKNNVWFTYTDFDRFVRDVKKPVKKEKLPNVVTYEQVLTNNYIATSSVMIWKSKIGNFYMKDVYHEDFILWLDILKKIKRAYGVSHSLMHYRLTRGSLSRNKFKSAIKVYGLFTQKMGFSYIKGLKYFMAWGVNTTIRYIR